MWNRTWTQTLGSDIPPPARGEWLRWVISAFGLWLLVATRPLWLNNGQFPQVPWFAWGCDVPRSIDFGLVIVVGIALIAIAGTAAQSRVNRWSLLLFAGSLSGLMLLDQHRCQPWAYQLVLVSLILAWSPHGLAIGLLRLMTISIYVHSAISKCDWSFCTGIGQSFLWKLQTLLTGREVAGIPGAGSLWPLLFPIGELLIAIGLIWPRSRRWALWGAIGMHLLLLLILGPWGLKHSTGVLIWNLLFILLNLILFGRLRTDSVNQTADPAVVSFRTLLARRAAVCLTAWAVVWPFGEPWGYCDLWPAWGLYAQHGERLAVFVADAALNQLPTLWQESAVPTQKNGNEMRVSVLRLQQVSLQQTWAPVYPQNRFSLGVALSLARDAHLVRDQISGTWYTPANRWTGKHESTDLKNLEEIERAAAGCRWNAKPRN